MNPRALVFCLVLTMSVNAQLLDPAKLLHPPTDSWPTYNGDYSSQALPVRSIKSMPPMWSSPLPSNG